MRTHSNEFWEQVFITEITHSVQVWIQRLLHLFQWHKTKMNFFILLFCCWDKSQSIEQTNLNRHVKVQYSLMTSNDEIFRSENSIKALQMCWDKYQTHMTLLQDYLPHKLVFEELYLGWQPLSIKIQKNLLQYFKSAFEVWWVLQVQTVYQSE